MLSHLHEPLGLIEAALTPGPRVEEAALVPGPGLAVLALAAPDLVRPHLVHRVSKAVHPRLPGLQHIL